MAKAKAKPAAKQMPTNFASEVIAAIKANGGRPWFQVHGDQHENAIQLLKAEGVIRWTNNGYVIIEKGAK